MRLTTFTDYTLRVLMYLAIEPSRLATIPEIACAYGISENHLMKVVYRLVRNGLIDSVRGKGGGIRLGQVVLASEGDAIIAECFSEKNNTCCITPACKLSFILAHAFEGFYEALDTYSLADLVNDPKNISYPTPFA